MRRTQGTLLIVAMTLAAGCGTANPPVGPGPQPPSSRLPAIPTVRGDLDLRVSYPRDSASVATRGDNFIFGSAGNAAARVWINGTEVEVRPNGGFLAFLPVPHDSVYRLRAELDGQVQTLEVPISIPAPSPEPGDSAAIVPGSVSPVGGWVVLPGERIEVGFTGTAGGTAHLVGPGFRVQLRETAPAAAAGASDFEVAPGDPAPASRAELADPARPRLVRYSGFFTAARILSADTTVYWPRLSTETRPAWPTLSKEAIERIRERMAGVRARTDAPLDVVTLGLPGDDSLRLALFLDSLAIATGGAIGDGDSPTRLPDDALPGGLEAFVELVVDGDTARAPLPLNMLVADPDRPRVGHALDPDPPEENGDGEIIARVGPGGGPYHYFWRNGTDLTLTGERNGVYRVDLAKDLTAWTPSGDIVLEAPGTTPPSSRVATVRMDPQPGWIDVHVALDRRLPYRIDEGDRSLSILVYGALSRANFLQHGRIDPYIVRGEWSQPTDDRFRVDIHLAAAPWGYETFWGEGDDLVLRIRRPPVVDARQPLNGLTVVVDPGHGGAERFTMGPTGLTEADANLGLGLALREELERRGATVVMTRTADSTLTLVERTTLARDVNADLLVSVHNNAFPDGVNPWENNGTSVYYNHPRAASLAWSVHEELLAELGLRDLGVGRADLAMARPTWMPAILTETMFMMIPEQEAALRDDDVRRRVALAHVRGLMEWLRSYAREQLEPAGLQ